MTRPDADGRDAGVPAGRRPGAPEGEAGRPVPVRPPRPERRIAAAFGLTAAAAIGFAAVYWQGGQTQLEGVLLAVAFAGLAYGLGAWSMRLMPQGPFVEEHEPFGSSRRERAAFAAEFEEDVQAISRRRFLGRALVLAVGALGAALLFPLRSLGPRPGRALYQTPWRAGAQAVTADGRPVRAADLAVGSVLTVFPGRPRRGRRFGRPADPGRRRCAAARARAGRVVAAGSGRPLQALHPRRLPSGAVRAGLQSPVLPLPPVGVRPARRARPISGPAARPLPQLPIEITADGYVRARGDFEGPVGPGFWSRPS